MKITISIDAMGGDNAPDHAILASIMFLEANPNVTINLYGKSEILNESINKKFKNRFEMIESKIKIINCEKIIKSDDDTSKVKDSKGTSMRMAIESVKNGESDACISCGNTGILMALSKIILRPMDEIERPAIVGEFPTVNGKCTFLDLGANLICSGHQLKEFAAMGYAYRRALNDELIFNPKIGLLNIGTENVKGHEYVKDADKLISKSSISEYYIGYVEPHEIPFEKSNIIVTDGYTGNIVIKSVEGASKLITSKIKNGIMNSGLLAKIGGVMVKNGLKKSMETINPKKYNCGLFIGLNGISVKGHGNSDFEALYNSIVSTKRLIIENINNRIIEYLK